MLLTPHATASPFAAIELSEDPGAALSLPGAAQRPPEWFSRQAANPCVSAVLGAMLGVLNFDRGFVYCWFGPQVSSTCTNISAATGSSCRLLRHLAALPLSDSQLRAGFWPSPVLACYISFPLTSSHFITANFFLPSR